MASANILASLEILGAIVVSTGSPSAGYLPVLNSQGKLDSSFISGGGGGVTWPLVSTDNHLSFGSTAGTKAYINDDGSASFGAGTALIGSDGSALFTQLEFANNTIYSTNNGLVFLGTTLNDHNNAGSIGPDVRNLYASDQTTNLDWSSAGVVAIKNGGGYGTIQAYEIINPYGLVHISGTACNVDQSGNIVATSFSGNGANITSVNYANKSASVFENFFADQGYSRSGLGTGTVFVVYNANTKVNSNFTAGIGLTYGVDTTNGPVTCTLPSSPNDGDWFVVFDVAKQWGTNTAIMGTSSNNFIDHVNTSATPGPYNLNSVPFTGQGMIQFIWDAALSVWSVN